jgi:transposase
VTDAQGVPLGALVSAGQRHEARWFERLMNTVRIRRRRRPDAVAGDRAYNAEHVRRWLAHRGIEAVIPRRSNQPRLTISRRRYRARNVVERCIGWLKCCRRITTRHEKLALHFLAMIKLAMIQRCLRILDP